MGFSKKGLRKMIRNDRVFYWCVKNDNEDDDRMYIVIQSEDKKFSISYMLAQQDKERPFSPINPFIIVKGKEFKGLNHLGKCWERFLVPHWKEDDAITPSFIGEIIDWCFTNEDVTSVNYKGEIMSERRQV